MQSNNKVKRWIWRIAKIGVLCSLVVISFIAGALVTLRLTLPLAVIGGLVNIAAAGAPELLGILVSGTSDQRLEILKHFTAQFGQPTSEPMDKTVWEYFRPGIQACTQDADPEVVKLAQDLIQQMSVKALQEATLETEAITP